MSLSLATRGVICVKTHTNIPTPVCNPEVYADEIGTVSVDVDYIADESIEPSPTTELLPELHTLPLPGN